MIIPIKRTFESRGEVQAIFARKVLRTYAHAHPLFLFEYAMNNTFEIPISMSQQVELLNIVSVIPDQEKFSSARFLDSLNAAIKDGNSLNSLLDSFFADTTTSDGDKEGKIANPTNQSVGAKKPGTLKDEIRASILKTLSSRLSSNVFKAIDSEALNSVYSSECHVPECTMMIRTLFDLSAAMRSSTAGGELKVAIDKVHSAQASGAGKVQSHIRTLLTYFKHSVTPTVPGNGLHFLKYLDANNSDVFDADKWSEHELSVAPIKLSFESAMQTLDYLLLGVRLHGKDPYGTGTSVAVSIENLINRDIEVLDISSLIRPIDFTGSGNSETIRDSMNSLELERFIRISYKKWMLKLFKDGFPMSDMRPAYVKEDDHALIALISMAYAESRATADLLSCIVSDLLEYVGEFKKVLSPSDETVFLHPSVIDSFLSRLKNLTDDAATSFLDSIFVRFDRLVDYNPQQLMQNGISLTFAPSGGMRASTSLYEAACHTGLCRLDSAEDAWNYDIEFSNRWQARKLESDLYYPVQHSDPDLIAWPPYNWPLAAVLVDDSSLKAVMTTEYEYGLYPLLAKFSSIFTCAEYSPKIQSLRHVSKLVFDTLASSGALKIVTITRKRDIYNILELPETPAIVKIVDAMFKDGSAFPAMIGISDSTVVTRMLSLEDEPSLNSSYTVLNEVGRTLFPDRLLIGTVYALNVVALNNKLIPTTSQGGKASAKVAAPKKGKWGKKQDKAEDTAEEEVDSTEKK